MGNIQGPRGLDILGVAVYLGGLQIWWRLPERVWLPHPPPTPWPGDPPPRWGARTRTGGRRACPAVDPRDNPEPRFRRGGIWFRDIDPSVAKERESEAESRFREITPSGTKKSLRLPPTQTFTQKKPQKQKDFARRMRQGGGLTIDLWVEGVRSLGGGGGRRRGRRWRVGGPRSPPPCRRVA